MHPAAGKDPSVPKTARLGLLVFFSGRLMPEMSENDMKRRIISVLLALVLVLSLLPTTVLATQPDAVPEEETVPLPQTEEQPQQVPDAGEEQQEAVPVMSSGANAHHHCV